MTSIRIIVCGGPSYKDRGRIRSTLASLSFLAEPGDVTIVHGASHGADTIAGEEAEALGYTIEPHPADWQSGGPTASQDRNEEMAQLGADACIVFPGGAGTLDLVRRVERHGIPVRYEH